METSITRERMDGQTFHRSGLLYYVNSTVLWPLGLALSVTVEENGEYSDQLRVIRVEPANVIVDSDPFSDDHPRARAMAWIADRLSQLSDGDLALAMEILSDPNNVAAFAVRGRDGDR